MKERLLLPESYAYKCELSTLIRKLVATKIAGAFHFDGSTYSELMAVDIAVTPNAVVWISIETRLALIAPAMLDTADFECIGH